MENTRTTSITKDTALQALGVVSKKQRKALASNIDIVTVAAGRRLVTGGEFLPTVLVGVTGTVLVTNDHNDYVSVDAPFVIDTWAADERRIAKLTVVAEAESTLLLIDHSYRDTAANTIKALDIISAQSRKTVEPPRVESTPGATQESARPTATADPRQPISH